MSTPDQYAARLLTATTERNPAWVNAYEFAKLGFKVFPLGSPLTKTNGNAPDGKDPLPGTHGHNDATDNPEQIAAWEKHLPGANVGIVPPDSVAIIDFDTRHDGLRVCNDMVAKGLLPRETFVVETGTGGLHIFVRVSPGTSLGSLSDIAPGISVINHGEGSPGYVVAPGSVNWATEKPYRIISSAPVAPLPPALCDRMRPRGSRNAERIATEDIDDARRQAAADKHFAIDAERAVQDVEAQAIDYAVKALEPVAVPGQRYTVLTKAGAMLARLGWSAASVETFAREFIARYGGDNVEHGVRGCVNSMSYPSGYYDLTAMMPSYARGQLAAALDAIPNPYGQAIKDGRAALAASVNLPGSSAQPAPAVLATPQVNTTGDVFFDSEDDGLPPKPITRIVEGLDVVDGTMVFLAGPPNAGKTPTAIMLSLCVANGLPFGDRKSTQRPVIYANFEKRYDVKQKLHRIAQGLGVSPKSVRVFHLGAAGAALSAEGAMNPTASLIKCVKDERAKTGVNPIVIVDTYASSVDDLDANDNLYAQPLKHFKAAVHAECDVSMVVLAHTRKRDDETQPFRRSDIAGSGQLGGLCEAIIGLHHPDPDNQHVVELTSVRSITTDMKPLRIEWQGGDGDPLTAKVISGEQIAAERKERPVKRTANEKRQHAYERLSLHVRTPGPTADAEIITISRARAIIGTGYQGKDADSVELVKYAIKQCVAAGDLVPAARHQERGAWKYRRPTAAELTEFHGAFDRERNSADMIARAAVAHQSGLAPPGLYVVPGLYKQDNETEGEQET